MKGWEMVGTYVIAALRPDQIAQAYPLIQAVVPTLDMQAWHRMASNARRHEEILVVINSREYIQGLSIFRHGDHPVVGSLLDVIFLIVASSADERGVTGMLYSAIRSRARELKCARIRFWSQNSQNWSRMRDEAQFNRVDHGLMVYSNDQD
jgi:hypothetical protein